MGVLAEEEELLVDSIFTRRPFFVQRNWIVLQQKFAGVLAAPNIALV